MPDKPRVLLVEDDATMAVMIRDILESGGYEVAHAFDGIYALQFLGVAANDELKEKTGTDWTFVHNEWTPPGTRQALPNLVISDCMMPRMDGFTLVNQMAHEEAVKQIPVIILTTKSKMEDPFVQLPNVKGFIAKPADPDQLLEMVGKALPKP